ncbi:hypothetical protein Acy02nite_07090 [Actinoplanes cyaneus]|uniref:Uncharacterized protein n=1 Tax=Actinoplanes cyaneus TaxID=52696 RepID=A0A919M347_9ACTN|nr:hypothetical protein [Actinoplanes cyaneus]MCW2135807.1 hypothetical protein [Actinoplanes cyaneus]GID62828.1 hypothetical protein Acy02nite_07090 [Actinoplanes cyaneus]
MRHLTALFAATLAGAALGASSLTAPARADVPGFALSITAPATFQAGGNAKTVTAVATSDQARCRKVRWTLVVRGGEVPLNRIGVTRVEDSGEFPTQVSVNGDTATIVDQQLDPGTLCRNRTVTGKWQLRVSGNDGGEVGLEVRAADAVNTQLTSNTATTEVTTKVATASPTPKPSRTTASPSAEPTEEEAEDEPTEAAVKPPVNTTSATALVPASAGQSNLLGPGLIVGGVFFFLGLLLLLRLRARTKEARREAGTLPTGFYTMP